MIRVEIPGLAEYTKKIGDLIGIIENKADKQIHGLAVSAVRYLKDGITRRQFPMDELSSSTLARRKFPDRPPLFNTGRYLRNIQVRTDFARGKKLGYRVGTQGKRYDLIAHWAEYGTKKSPSRPHWRPTALWVKSRVDVVGRGVLRAAHVHIRGGSV